MGPELQRIIRDRNTNELFQRAKEEWERRGAMRMNNAMLDQFDTFDIELPGYYGPVGFEKIQAHLRNRFILSDPPLLPARDCMPLDQSAFLRRVLLPTVVLRLIMQDRDLATVEEADAVRIESIAFGKAMHTADVTELEGHEDEDEPFGDGKKKRNKTVIGSSDEEEDGTDDEMVIKKSKKSRRKKKRRKDEPSLASPGQRKTKAAPPPAEKPALTQTKLGFATHVVGLRKPTYSTEARRRPSTDSEVEDAPLRREKTVDSSSSDRDPTEPFGSKHVNGLRKPSRALAAANESSESEVDTSD